MKLVFYQGHLYQKSTFQYTLNSLTVFICAWKGTPKGKMGLSSNNSVNVKAVYPYSEIEQQQQHFLPWVFKKNED